MDDYHFALLLCQEANLNRDPKKHPKPYKVEEFLVRGDAGSAPAAPAPPKPKQTVEDMKRMAAAFTTGLGGTIVQKERPPDAG